MALEDAAAADAVGAAGARSTGAAAALHGGGGEEGGVGDDARYTLVLKGRRVGPFDRRTIVGMRIKNAISSAHKLVAADGAELSVADLIGRWPRAARDFHPNRTGSFSVVKATYPASLTQVRGRGYPIPRFRGEIEARVQVEVLRLAGRFRHGLFGWHEDRMKIKLVDIAHRAVEGSLVTLWLRVGDGRPMQRLLLELFTPQAALEFAGHLEGATPHPSERGLGATEAPRHGGQGAPASAWMVWAPVLGIAGVVVLGLVILLSRRTF